MANFVHDNLTLPTKANLVPLGGGDNIINFMTDADWAILTQTHADIRSAIQENWFNVKDFGAKGNGVAYDRAAFQLAYNAAAAVGGFVFAPPGTYRFDAIPLLCTSSYVHILGSGVNVTIISKDFHQQFGPAIVVSAAAGTLPTGSSLLTGAGASFDMNANAQAKFVDLRDLPYTYMNGWTAACFELTVKSPNATNGNSSLLGSRGKPLGDGPQNIGMQVTRTGSASIGFRLTTTSGAVAIDSGAGTIVTNTIHNVACDYDGSHMRIFIDGVLKATGTQTGTIVQNVLDGLQIGLATGAPLGVGIDDNANDFVDAILVSHISQHTTNYTPSTAKRVAGAVFGAIWGCNFDKMPGTILGIDLQNNTTGWVPIRWNDPAGITRNTLMNLTVNSGVYVQKCTDYTIENVFINGGQYGIFLNDNSYQSRIANLKIVTDQTNNADLGGVLIGAASGLTLIQDTHITTGGIAIVCNGSTVDILNSFVATNSWALMLLNHGGQTTYNVFGFICSDEGRLTALPGLVAMDGNIATNFYGCQFELSQAPSAANALITVSGDAGDVNFYGCAFQPGASNPEIIKNLHGSPTHHANLFGWSTWVGLGSVPWSLTAGYVQKPSMVAA